MTGVTTLTEMIARPRSPCSLSLTMPTKYGPMPSPSSVVMMMKIELVSPRMRGSTWSYSRE